MKLIAFEGPDCVGKTTQVQELKAKLKNEGYSVSSYKIPYREDHLYSSQIIYHMIDNELISDNPIIFQAAMAENRRYFQQNILNKANEDFVLVDRWNLSTKFYGEVQGVSSELTETLLEGLKEPESYIIFDGVPFDRESKDILDRDLDLQEKLREKYKNYHGKNVFHVNANNSLLDVSNRIWTLLQGVIQGWGKRICPMCGHGELELKSKLETLILKNKTVEVQTLGWWCDSCGDGIIKGKDLLLE